ncbi:MAG TPA: hypothetical protein VGJ13_07680 [Pseudonocardiaceae bacterium]
MLLLAILLLLSAVGLLAAAVVTSQLGLAWVSVGVSALAAMAVLLWRRRVRRSRPSTADDESAAAGRDAEPPAPVPRPAEGPADPVLGPGLGSNKVADADSEAAGTADPAEEDTEPADLLVVLDSSDEVLVVDEQPRYHLARCRWPDPAKTERLPVREARELGFVPCDSCRPDVEIADRHRAETRESAQQQPSRPGP